MRFGFYLLLTLMAVIPAHAQQPPANASPSDPQPAPPMVYVLGRVQTPSAVPFSSSTTLLAAIEQAGGALPKDKGSVARILRRTHGCEYVTQIKVALKEIRAGRARDIRLQAGDIVEVRSRKRGRFYPHEGAIPCEPPQTIRLIY
jgi:protein involved in polysaccharide export with SLBB domain